MVVSLPFLIAVYFYSTLLELSYCMAKKFVLGVVSLNAKIIILTNGSWAFKAPTVDSKKIKSSVWQSSWQVSRWAY